ncbi:SDR family NAD(P)-dependent oxidoreductase [Ensifer sp. SL37]|uniref:SDR family NAD(P)-dependent oxidoreductase n=1 Tax=Ensifer sp. SL37 TaxID=2995137 RepID=UPI002273C76D|nr:SDR family NAD(P)-dependent oxidoreductase [Ensifer sp. SL37]MCY1745322.1 SDR family NAD(P)-dependent oxidoreductase [Ensifer sp. SL37]
MTVNQVNEVEGKVAIVTGAASGIGKATVELLRARGAKVIAEDVDPDVRSLKADGIVPLVADISRDGSAEEAVALALEHFGKLDLLVNNAARIVYKPVVEMTRHDWDYVMETNVTGAFLHSREAAKVMIKQKSGYRVLCLLLRLSDNRRLHVVQRRVGTVDPDVGAGACRAWHPRQCDRLG